MRIILTAILFAALGQAETAFLNLTPNFDGSGVWFSSWLRMKGTDQYPHSKIFQWDDAKGVRLYDQKPATVKVYGNGARESSTAYNLFSVSATADGGTVAVTGALDCTTGENCALSDERYRSVIRRTGADSAEVMGSASLSPNGRFAYLTSSIVPVFVPNHDRLRDVASGQEISLNGWAGTFPYRHRVANDGTVVVTGSKVPPTPLYLRSWPTGELRPLPTTAAPVMINDAATRLVYGAASGLVVYDIAAARETALASNSSPFVFDISNDGSVIAYLDAGQVWIVRQDGSGKRRVDDGSESIAEMVLSGDGNFVFAVTASSRIVRIDMRNGVIREIAPKATLIRTGSVTGASPVAVPGSLYEFTAQSLPEIAEVRLLGKTQAIVSQNGGDLLIQVANDIAEGTDWVELVMREQTPGPFVSSVIWTPVEASLYSPSWYRLPDNHIAALHGDFSAVVSSANPGHPGEILHVFGSGFGPVSPQPAPGEPARANPLSRVIEPMLCGLEGLTPGPADVLFAGLAPGFIGLYQFDVRLPATLGDGDTYLSCWRSIDPPVGRGASGLLPISSR